MKHNDTAKRIVWRISPNCVLGACYAFVVSFLLNHVKYTNILKIIVVLFGGYKYKPYICIVIKNKTTTWQLKTKN